VELVPPRLQLVWNSAPGRAILPAILAAIYLADTFTMSNSGFNRATHISIAWGIALAVITLIEWRSLDRNPIEQQIFSPFIERDIRVSRPAPSSVGELGTPTGSRQNRDSLSDLQYEVQFHFNGPLFLAYFFGPVLTVHGLGLLLSRLKQG
jgi:hypothetical protein